ncbi:ribosome silencing factor [Legionella spiritensis]|uniref:Ribosomal silencing factor RsfS n=1 Tax=Legionella spiritensis TaxID=452 RepID=A0A0W0Z4H5_LEGSP|nr:ribosome silencing factor [Legionella spiritensis]KTD64055.1 Ribosomal silencing factor RsfS [Legionella spiritensis]SNV37457.1 putative Iojap-related protein [Legionella spiritensis]VEG90090.1 putative Iojap-related protein [Legionella spiritensis]
MPNQPGSLQLLLSILDEMQAIDIKTIDVSHQTTVTDYMILCSGRSSRHVKSIAEAAMEKMKSNGFSALGSHGVETGDWALVDFGDFVLHVMQPDSRAFYNLEGLWNHDG